MTVTLTNGNRAAILNYSKNSESGFIFFGIAEYNSDVLTPQNRVKEEIYYSSIPDNGIDRPDSQIWKFIAQKTTDEKSQEFEIFGTVTL